MPKSAVHRLALLRLEMGRITREIRDELRRLKGSHTNPDMVMLAPNCGVISSKHLGRNWSPEYHIFSGQYEALLQFLGTRPDTFRRRLSEVLRRGSFRRAGSVSYQQPVHPDVLAQLRRIRNGEPCQTSAKSDSPTATGAKGAARSG